MLPEVNHRWHGQDSQCQDGRVENAIKKANNCLLIIKVLKIEDGFEISRQ